MSGWLGIPAFVVAILLIWSMVTHPAHELMLVSLTVQVLPPGLGALAFPLFLLGVGNAGLTLDIWSVIIGPALFSGGLVGFIAGMLTWRSGNTAVGALLCVLSVFWVAPGLLLLALFHSSAQSINLAGGVFFLLWAVAFGGLFGASSKRCVMLMAFSLAALSTFLVFAISLFISRSMIIIISGWLGLLTSAIAWYGMLALLRRETKGPFTLPVGAHK